MTLQMSLTELRPKLPQVIDIISASFERCVVTRHGKPEVVILAEEDYANLMETLDILCDKPLLKDIKKAQDDLKKGRGIPWAKAKKSLGYV